MKEAEKAKIRDLLRCEHSINGLFCNTCRYDASTYFYDVKVMLASKGLSDTS
jgi:hypothetical protein